jgi:hypothetical protein
MKIVVPLRGLLYVRYYYRSLIIAFVDLKKHANAVQYLVPFLNGKFVILEILSPTVMIFYY